MNGEVLELTKAQKRSLTIEKNKKKEELLNYCQEHKIHVGFIVENYLNEYLQNFEYLWKIDLELSRTPLYVEHTNKAGATNSVKNPLLAERKAYSLLLLKILKELHKLDTQKKAVEKEVNPLLAMRGRYD